MKLKTIVAAFIIAICAASSAVQADIRDAARQGVEEKSDAVITIEVVTQLKYSYGGSQQESEQKQEVFGIVVDASGLVVTALSSVDQAQLYRRMSSEQTDTSFSSTVKSIKYILSDNTEIPATIVLRDPDLDLAFLRPQNPAEEELTFIDLSDAAEPGMLEPCYSIGRMGRIARRVPVGMTGEIQGIVRRPRAYYIPAAEIVSAGTGIPVFNEENKILGIVLVHIFPGGRAAATDTDEMAIHVVVPASEVLDVMQQVPEQAAEEAAAEEAETDATVEPEPEADTE